MKMVTFEGVGFVVVAVEEQGMRSDRMARDRGLQDDRTSKEQDQSIRQVMKSNLLQYFMLFLASIYYRNIVFAGVYTMSSRSFGCLGIVLQSMPKFIWRICLFQPASVLCLVVHGPSVLLKELLASIP